MSMLRENQTERGLHLPSLNRPLDFTRLVVWVFVPLMLLAGLFVRMHDATDPPFDFHPTRQLRVAMITRGIYLDMLPNVDVEIKERAKDFAQSMGRYEPPILENITALGYRLAGGEEIWVPRLINSLFWIIGGFLVFDLALRMTTRAGALIVLGFYLFLPFSVFGSRSFQPDPGMVMWIILATYAFYRWGETLTWKWALMAGVASGLAVLIKAVAGYLVAPVAVAVVLYVLGLRKAFTSRQVWAMALLMILPPFIYYFLILQERSSEYFVNWSLSLLHLILSPGFYAGWVAHLDNLFSLMIIFLALTGVVLAKPLAKSVLIGLWIGYFIYGITLPHQIATHSYYNLQLIPVLALSLAPVAAVLVAHVFEHSVAGRLGMLAILLVGLVYAVAGAWTLLAAQDYRDVPAYWQEVAANLPEEGRTIALTQDYGYPLMYYGWRKVSLWPVVDEQKLAQQRGRPNWDFEQEFLDRTQGRRYFLVTDLEELARQPELAQALQRYPLAAQGDQYWIYDLGQETASLP